MGQRAFRFGVQVASAPDLRRWTEQARAAEDLGYATLWMPDHFDHQWGPLVGLTAAATATTTIRIGGLVFDNDYRHPGVLAKELATLDLVSEGRLEVGIGAGWLRADYDELGLPYDPPATRVARLGEAVQVLKTVWAGPPATHAGDHYRLDRAQALPAPVQRPHPPLLIAGGGRRVLSLAAREADIVGFNTNLSAGRIGSDAARQALVERFRERVAWVRAAAGPRFDQLELQCNTFVCSVGSDRRSLAELLAPTFGVSTQEALAVPLVLAGSVDEVCDTLHQRRDELGFSYWSIPGGSLHTFAPVVARLAGQ